MRRGCLLAGSGYRGFSLAGSVSAWVLQALSRGRLTGLSTAGTTPSSQTALRPTESPYGRSPRLESPTLENATGVRKRLHNATCSGVALARPRTSVGDPVSVCGNARRARAVVVPRGRVQGRSPGTFRALSTCRGSAIPTEATYRRVILLDATPCSKRGLFKPSINPAADHETGLVSPRNRACKPTKQGL
jgi:hypothetical protein